MIKARLLLLFLFISIFSYAQKDNNYYQQKSIKAVKEEPAYVYINWTCEKEGWWGSFWWKVTKRKINNIYYYNVYVYSNSYFNVRDSYGNYKKAITKLTDCYIWAKDYDEAVKFDVGSVVFDWESTYLFQFYTDDPRPIVDILYSKVSSYDYSKVKKY